LDDLHALEKMLGSGVFDSGPRRIGGEQEMFLVDGNGRPACVALKILDLLDDPHFTTELALFQLEINLDPFPFEGNCFSRMEGHLDAMLERVRQGARECGADVALAGILPSLRKSEIGMESMTPTPRYIALNKAVCAMRGGLFDFHIKGADELHVTHDSVMMEACNSSFQVHLQVSPGEFARLYNTSQFYAAPILAAAVNSPLLFGRRLWQETRIALFQHATDTRAVRSADREQIPRVHFGRRWVRDSVIELFKEDVARFRVLMSNERDSDPFEDLEKGDVPQLNALRLHGGTIWRWTRPCYGITEGKATLRIENRLLPSGPTVRDEMANAAFWLGLMASAAREETDPSREIEFDAAQENFLAAARLGLSAQFSWLKGRTVPAQQVIKEELLPRAREGLASAGIDPGEAGTYLDVIAERVESGQTGARWILQSLGAMKKQPSRGTASERLSALTRAVVARQATGEPVHLWPPARLEEAGGWKRHYTRVEQFMTTDLYTVREDDSLDLVANLMDWEKVRHVLVEDENHKLLGIVSYRSLLRVLGKGDREREGATLPVSAIMKRNPFTVSPDTPTLEAIELMGKNGISTLPVVRDGRLAGVITERDFVVLAREMLVQKLRE
jgi:CBS domain-containing protein